MRGYTYFCPIPRIQEQRTRRVGRGHRVEVGSHRNIFEIYTHGFVPRVAAGQLDSKWSVQM